MQLRQQYTVMWQPRRASCDELWPLTRSCTAGHHAGCPGSHKRQRSLTEPIHGYLRPPQAAASLLLRKSGAALKQQTLACKFATGRVGWHSCNALKEESKCDGGTYPHAGTFSQQL